MANPETLECLSCLLESQSGSMTLLERGDDKPIRRHTQFRLFACMNPATDVGKKELPAGLRNRFTEFFMEELDDKSDLEILIEDYLKEVPTYVPTCLISSIKLVNLGYQSMRTYILRSLFKKAFLDEKFGYNIQLIEFITLSDMKSGIYIVISFT